MLEWSFCAQLTAQGGTTMTTAYDAAAFFISCATQDGNLITHLKLQKLCYYAQGYSLALMGESMFTEPIEAWEHGPVVRAVWDRYKQYGKRSIPRSDELPEIEPWRLKILAMVHRRYGWMSAWELRNRTHDEMPWRHAWLSEESNAELSHDAMRAFFRSTLRGERLAPEADDKETVLDWIKGNDELRAEVEKGRAEIAAGRGIRWD